jgi:hypothetical protein
MLSKEQIEVIATKINKKIDIPVIGEKFEQKIIVFGLKKVDDVLDKQLPPDWAKLLDDVTDGIEPGTKADFEAIKNNLVNFLNAKVDIPILGEQGEQQLFSLAMDIIFDALRKGDKLP